jgi:carbon-monoxide dehydrogenase medium subunit
MTRHRAVEFSPMIAERLPLLAEAIKLVAHLPIRSRGTIGGSIAHADPAAELPMVLQALEGEVLARGPAGERIIKATDFFEGLMTTALHNDEMIVEVRFPAMGKQAGWAVEEFARRRAIRHCRHCLSSSVRAIAAARRGLRPPALEVSVQLTAAEEVLERWARR